MTITITAKSFDNARKMLKKYYHMEWYPIRISDTYLYRFVNVKKLKAIDNDLPINKVMEKLEYSFKY